MGRFGWPILGRIRLRFTASTMAGWAFSVAGVGLVHGMSHSLGAHVGVPHGTANGILLPHVMRFNAAAAAAKLALGIEIERLKLEIARLRRERFGASAERSARIEGARAEAAAAEAGAKQELDSYHDALRKARGEIYAEQELTRQEALENRGKLLKAMRSRAQEDVNAAKKRIAAELAAARVEVERETPALASQIARAILDKPSTLSGGSGRGSGR